jgi:hypothetical protein
MSVALDSDTGSFAKLVPAFQVELAVGHVIDAVREVEPGRYTHPCHRFDPASPPLRRTIGKLSRASRARSGVGQ